MHYFDTHAIVGLLGGEPRYEGKRGLRGYTHHVNFLETLIKLLQRGGDASAWERIESLGLGVLEATPEDLRFAAELKTAKEFRAHGFSLPDALGYAIARRLGLAFLTGDPGFKGLPGVEFVE